MQGTAEQGDFPGYWDWNVHGLECAGTFLRLDEAPTQFGTKGIVVLDVGGIERSVWLTTSALMSKFADELQRRRADDFDVGERVVIRRGAEKKTSQAGREYWPFKVEFADAPKRTARQILGVDQPPAETTGEDFPSATGGDDIPF